jgi:drug/metabolite transporter (DMT)-like permease
MSGDALSARLQTLGAALLFSTGGAAIKATSLSGWQVASFRAGIATIALVLLLPAARRRWTARALAVGLAYGATTTLFVAANKLTTAANTIFLQSSAPLYVLLLSPWLGNVLAICSGVTWALTLLGLRWLGRDTNDGSSMTAVVSGNVMAFLFGLPLALPLGSHGAADWLAVVFLGIVQIGLAYVLLTRALGRVPALEASLLLLIEPVLNPIWTWLLHGEAPGAWAVLGGTLILGATAFRTTTAFRQA